VIYYTYGRERLRAAIKRIELIRSMVDTSSEDANDTTLRFRRGSSIVTFWGKSSIGLAEGDKQTVFKIAPLYASGRYKLDRTSAIALVDEIAARLAEAAKSTRDWAEMEAIPPELRDAYHIHQAAALQYETWATDCVNLSFPNPYTGPHDWKQFYVEVADRDCQLNKPLRERLIADLPEALGINIDTDEGTVEIDTLQLSFPVGFSTNIVEQMKAISRIGLSDADLVLDGARQPLPAS
jgi:hypothetical protein